MPKWRTPTTFTVMRPMRINGTAYAKGATLTNVKSIRNLSSLVSKGWISATPDPYYRKTTKGTGWRTAALSFLPSQRAKLP